MAVAQAGPQWLSFGSFLRWQPQNQFIAACFTFPCCQDCTLVFISARQRPKAKILSTCSNRSPPSATDKKCSAKGHPRPISHRKHTDASGQRHVGHSTGLMDGNTSHQFFKAPC